MKHVETRHERSNCWHQGRLEKIEDLYLRVQVHHRRYREASGNQNNAKVSWEAVQETWRCFYQVDMPLQIAYVALRKGTLGVGRFSRHDEAPVRRYPLIGRPVGSNNEGLIV
jgi:hypothetical protein